MAKIDKKNIALLLEKAKLHSIVVAEVPDVPAALSYALDICEKKDACQLLLSGCEHDLSGKGAAVCDRPASKVIAAPDLSETEFAALKKEGMAKGFTVIKGGMREHLAGIDIAVTHAELGIAETATSMIASNSEELRLATMIAESHVIILPKSKVLGTSYEAEAALDALLKKETPTYTAFISGASRTADIERVLAIGVHGPLELHLALVEA